VLDEAVDPYEVEAEDSLSLMNRESLTFEAAVLANLLQSVVEIYHAMKLDVLYSVMKFNIVL
jgi:hypothetical protein